MSQVTYALRKFVSIRRNAPPVPDPRREAIRRAVMNFLGEDSNSAAIENLEIDILSALDSLKGTK